MCQPFSEVHPAPANYLRPDTVFTPGSPVEVDPVLPQGSASTPPFTFSTWRPR